VKISFGSSKLVISGGLAELFSGSISMGLGAYLAAATDRDQYIAERKREEDEVVNKPEDEKEEIYEILERYGIGRDASSLVVRDLERNPESWVQVREEGSYPI
jgi:vacuolar iron transporter family protein